MATLTYDPATHSFDNGTGGIAFPTAADTLVFPDNGGVPYVFTLPDDLTVSQIDIQSKDAEVDLPNGSTLNANVSVSNGGTFRLGVPDTGSGTATLNGSLSLTVDHDFSGVLTSGSAVIEGPSGSSVTVNGSGALSPFWVGKDSNVTVNIPMSVNVTNSFPFASFIGQLGGTLTLTQAMTTDDLIAASSLNPAKLIFTGVLDNTGNTVDFDDLGNVEFHNTVINGGTVRNAVSKLNGATANGVTLWGTVNIPLGISDTFAGGVTGVPGAIINAIGSSLILSEQVVGITANLSDGATQSAPASNVTMALSSSTTINTLSAATWGGGAGSGLLYLYDEGTFNALPATTAYGVQVGRMVDTLDLATGSSFNVYHNTTVTIESQLDNESTITLFGGGVIVVQQPTGLDVGDISFKGPNGTLQFGDAGSAFYAPTGTLTDFSTGDQVVFSGATFGMHAHVSLSLDVLGVYDTNGTLDGTFTLQRGDNQSYNFNDFVFGQSANGMTLSVDGIAPENVPIVTAGDPTFYTGGAPVVLDGTVTVADASSATLASATVTDVNFMPGDTLNYTSQNSIIGSYNATTGLLSLSGTATVADYQTALQSVSYSFSPANGDPTGGGSLPTRTIGWSVNDGSATSPIDTSTLTVVRVGPSVTTGGIVNADGATPVVTDGGQTIADPSSPTLAGAEIEITGGTFFGDGDLLAATTTGTAIIANYDPTTETLQLTGEDTLADYLAALRSVTFSTTSRDPTNGGTDDIRTITVEVQDDVAASALASSQVNVACFATGTAIATPDGDVPVARLAIGDVVVAKFSGRAAVTWIGRCHIDCRRHIQPRKVWPVRIAAGAFGAETPSRDLWISPDHAVYFVDVLIPIKHLINGTSIVQVPTDEVTYYHVELPEHDLLSAEGLLAESYLETGDSFGFASGSSVRRMHPDLSSLKWAADGCAPLIVTGPELDAARMLVNTRAAAMVQPDAVASRAA